MAMRTVRSGIVILSALGAAALPATAALAVTPTTLYVNGASASCSNSGAGTQTTPFCTISAGAAKAVAGQTVQVAAATYNEAVTVPKSGTAGAPIVYSASGATVTGGVNGFKLSGKSYVTIHGFTVTKTSGVGILVSSSSHVTIDGNNVSVAGQRTSGLTQKGISLSGTTASTVSNNVTHDNSDAGIGISSASNGNTISGNESYANARGFSRAAAGIDLRNSTGNLVIWTNGDHGIDVHATNDASVVANTVYKNYDSGIEMTGSLRTYLANNISADNGINSARTSGQLRADATSAPSTVADYDLLNQSAPLGSKTVFIDWAGTKYTTLAKFTAATGQETHGIQAAPQFAGPPTDLHLTSGSPAVNSGNNGASGEPSTDADGTSRPQGGIVDRGAYEFH
jgi:parallel beta-helix repeat protein